MLYVAGLLFLAALALMGLDFAGIRWAHSAGVTGTILMLGAFVLALVKEISVERHHHPRHHHS
jgi:hypothetical protein